MVRARAAPKIAAAKAKATPKAKANADAGRSVRGVQTRVKSLLARNFHDLDDRCKFKLLKKPYPTCPEPISLAQYLTSCTVMALQRNAEGRVLPSEITLARAVWGVGGTDTADEARGQLEVKDRTMKIDYDLKKACALAMTTVIGVRDRKMLLSVLPLISDLNQAEIVGVLRVLLPLNVHSGVANAQYVIEVIERLIIRGFHRQFPDEMMVMVPIVKDSLCNLFSVARSKDEDCGQLWRDHGEVVKEMFPAIADKVDQLLRKRQAKEPLPFDSLATVIAGGKLMKAMFKEEFTIALQNKLVSEIKVTLETLEQKNALTQNDYNSAKDTLMTKATDIANQATDFEAKISLTMMYRGVLEIKLSYRNIFTLVDKAFSLFLKSATAGQENRIPLTSPEQWVLGEPSRKIAISIDNKHLAASVTGRGRANRLLKRAQHTAKDDVDRTMDYNKSYLTGHDQDWDLEADILAALHDKVETALENSLMDYCPSERNAFTFNEAHDKFEKLTASNLWSYAETCKTGPVAASWSLVALCKRGLITKTKFDAYTCLDRKVVDSLKYFCQANVFQPGTLSAVSLIGNQALTHYVDKVTGGSVDPILLVTLTQFKFMLEDEVLKELETKARGITLASMKAA